MTCPVWLGFLPISPVNRIDHGCLSVAGPDSFTQKAVARLSRSRFIRSRAFSRRS